MWRQNQNNRCRKRSLSIANSSHVPDVTTNLVETISRPNPLSILLTHSTVSVLPKMVFGSSISDEFRVVVESFNASFDFDTQQLAVKCESLDASRIEVKSCVIKCNGFVLSVANEKALDKEATLIIEMIDRHPYDTNFVLELKFTYTVMYTTNTRRKKLTKKLFTCDIKYNLEIPRFQTDTGLKFTYLMSYDPDGETTEEFFERRRQASFPTSEDKASLFTRLTKAVTFEDLQSRENLKHLSLHDVEIEGAQNSYFITTSRTRIIKAERWKEMSMCLVPMENYRGIYNYPENCFYVKIKNMNRDTIRIDTTKYLRKVRYHVDFIPNRIGIRACHNALECVKSYKLTSFLEDFNEAYAFKSIGAKKAKIDQLKLNPVAHFDWSNKSIASNFEQKLAIKNILNCTAYPCPQIVFGPPGTGKTTTLVECVVQIIKLRPECRVLIATQSNSASDEIGVRLLNYVSIKEFYRFYSPSMLNPTTGKLNAQLKMSSNLRNGKVEWPTQEELQYFKVVISTLTTSSRLAQSSIGNEHFDYIFIDEISCATEPEALIPIIGLGTSAGKVTSNIILLGDHKQLGPVLTCKELGAELGLGVSLMERMMNSCPKYAKLESNLLRLDNQEHPYDDRYVVQLLDNFRSHPAILKFSSDQFYNGSLRPKMALDVMQMTESWEFLPNRKFPVMFHAVITECKLDGTSSFNVGEIEMVKVYVKLLLMKKLGDHKIKQNDIGIITPYLAQLKKLKESVGSVWPGIEMGTAEYFQGREKPVIIISTVKSQRGVGFLGNVKRCNVMLTRAKYFEVVIGNPGTLSMDTFWCKFIEYCKENESLTHQSINDMALNIV